MSRIDDTFSRLEKAGQIAFMPYITAGYPSLDITESLIRAFDAEGVDIIEIGFPFSDPLADGPTIQMSSQHALGQGVTPEKVINMVSAIRKDVGCVLLAMTYVNPVHELGYSAFVEKLKQAGFDGIVVPDLPPDEGGELYGLCADAGLDRIQLVAPTSSDERIKLAADSASGFLYCVSLAGVTGARQELSQSVKPFLERVKKQTALPLGLGFGISSTEQIDSVADHADGVIVGSAIVDIIHKNIEKESDDIVAGVIEFIKPMVARAHSKPAGA